MLGYLQVPTLTLSTPRYQSFGSTPTSFLQPLVLQPSFEGRLQPFCFHVAPEAFGPQDFSETWHLKIARAPKGKDHLPTHWNLQGAMNVSLGVGILQKKKYFALGGSVPSFYIWNQKIAPWKKGKHILETQQFFLGGGVKMWVSCLGCEVCWFPSPISPKKQPQTSHFWPQLQQR